VFWQYLKPRFSVLARTSSNLTDRPKSKEKLVNLWMVGVNIVGGVCVCGWVCVHSRVSPNRVRVANSSETHSSLWRGGAFSEHVKVLERTKIRSLAQEDPKPRLNMLPTTSSNLTDRPNKSRQLVVSLQSGVKSPVSNLNLVTFSEGRVCRVCRLIRVLQLFAITRYKLSINPFFNTKLVPSH
jgi:hypothetical protein